MAKLNELKQTYEEFTPESFTYNLTGAIKWYKFDNGNNHVLTMGNFDITEKTIDIEFQKSGKWYEFFSRDSVDFSSAQQNIVLAPGEYRLFSTRKFEDPHVSTNIKESAVLNNEISIYPNPAETELNLLSSVPINEIRIFSVTGKLMMLQNPSIRNITKLNVQNLTPGIYIIQAKGDKDVSTMKFVKR